MYINIFNQLVHSIANKLITISFPGAAFTLFYCYINDTSIIYCVNRLEYILLYYFFTAYGIYVAVYF